MQSLNVGDPAPHSFAPPLLCVLVAVRRAVRLRLRGVEVPVPGR